MVVAGLVVREGPVLGGFGELLDIDRLTALQRDLRGGLEHGQRAAGVAVREQAEPLGDLEPERANAALHVGQRAAHDLGDRRIVERPERHHAAPRQERAVHRERRVLGRRADEHAEPVLDVRQERVLLRAVEAVDLVDEEQRRAPTLAARDLGAVDRLAHFLDAGEDRGERLEPEVRRLGDQPRERRLATPGRSEEQQRPGLPVGERSSQSASLPDHLLLAEELVEGPRAHPLGEGPRVRPRSVRLRILEQAHRRCLRASKSRIPVATATLRLSIVSAIGIRTATSAASRIASGTPAPSLPSAMSVGFVQSASR